MMIKGVAAGNGERPRRSSEISHMSRKARSLTRSLRDCIVKHYGSVRAAFRSIDVDNSKSVTFKEFNDMIRNRNLSQLFTADEIREVYDQIDKDGSGEVSVDEAIEMLDVGHQTIADFEK